MSYHSRFIYLLAFLSILIFGQRWRPAWATFTVEAETINNELISGQLIGSFGLQPTVAYTYQTRPAGGIEIETQAGLTQLAIDQLRSLKFQALRQLTIVSNTETQCFSLGNVAINLPEPPNWYASIEGSRYWKPATLAHPSYNWFYIPGSSWIWSPDSLSGLDAQGEVVLFRHQFPLATNFHIVEGRLFLSVDDHLDGLYVNQVPLAHPKGSLVGQLLAYDVTNLLRQGVNILAVKAVNDQSKELNFAGLSFKFELLGYLEEQYQTGLGLPEKERAKPGRPETVPGVVIFTINNDRISGDLRGVAAHLTEIRVAYLGAAEFAIDNDWIDNIIVNYEALTADRQTKPTTPAWRQVAGIGSHLFRLAKGEGIYNMSKSPDLYWQLPVADLGFVGSSYGSRLSMDGKPGAGAELRDGSFVPGRLLGLEGNDVELKPPFGSPTKIPVSRISQLFPNPVPIKPEERKYVRFRPESIGQIGRVRMINGDIITGVIEELKSSEIVLFPPYGSEIRIKTSFMASCDFPYSPQSYLWTRNQRPGRRSVQVALIGDIDKQIPFNTTIYYQVARCLAEMGINYKWLNALEMVQPEVLNPGTYPILINIDEQERYYHSVLKPDDGFNTLASYVKSGGTLIHLARGAPFSFPYERNPTVRGGWLAGKPGAELNRLIGLKLIVPGDDSLHARSFELPDNNIKELHFELNQRAPLATFLPRQIEFPLIRDTRFRAVVPVARDKRPSQALVPGEFYPVYFLKDNKNTKYGSAMAIVQYGPGHYSVYVSHLLAKSSYNNTPMINYLMPVLVHLASP